MTLQLPDFSAILKGYLNHPSLVSEVDEEAIGRAVTRQLTVTDSGPALRLSGLGKCRKALAYAHHETPPNGREIDARARTVFALGDMTEAFLVTALDQALEQQAVHQQLRLQSVAEGPKGRRGPVGPRGIIFLANQWLHARDGRRACLRAGPVQGQRGHLRVVRRARR